MDFGKDKFYKELVEVLKITTYIENVKLDRENDTDPVKYDHILYANVKVRYRNKDIKYLVIPVANLFTVSYTDTETYSDNKISDISVETALDAITETFIDSKIELALDEFIEREQAIGAYRWTLNTYLRAPSLPYLIDSTNKQLVQGQTYGIR